MIEPAVEFLRKHGADSVLSLGCGEELREIDNHIRLFISCGLKYYVGIDRVSHIGVDPGTAIMNPGAITPLLSEYFAGKPDLLYERARVFPNTWVEDLSGIHCSVVVCQRVLPFRHWESVIKSMGPALMLQEDLHGCELQDIGGAGYVKDRAGIRHYRLNPFRPYRFLPGERNMILWRRRDFYTSSQNKLPWWKRFWW
jgi:hypothetical protein